MRRARTLLSYAPTAGGKLRHQIQNGGRADKKAVCMITAMLSSRSLQRGGSKSWMETEQEGFVLRRTTDMRISGIFLLWQNRTSTLRRPSKLPPF